MDKSAESTRRLKDERLITGKLFKGASSPEPVQKRNISHIDMAIMKIKPRDSEYRPIVNAMREL